MNGLKRVLVAACLAALACCTTACAYPIASVVYGGVGGGPPPPPPLTVTLSPGSPAFANATYTTSGTYTTNTVTATAAGGVGADTFLWTYVSGSATPTVDAATAAATTFSAVTVAPNNYNAVWKVTVTDSAAHTASANVNVNFTSAGTFPLDVLARGIVADNVVQTLIWNPSSGVPNYTPTPKPGVAYCTVDVNGACTGSQDFDNMANIGITFIRIPTDVQQSYVGLPYLTSYLSNVASTSGTYDAATGLVTWTMSSVTQIVPPATPTATAPSSTTTVNVSSAAGIVDGESIADTTHPGAIPAGTLVYAISGSTLTLSNPVTGVLNGDALSVTDLVTVSSTKGTCTFTYTSNGAFTGVNQIVISPNTNNTATTSTITDTTTPSAIPGGTTITGINAGTNTLTLSANVTGMLNGDTLSVVTKDANCSQLNNANSTSGSPGFVVQPGSGGTTLKYNIGAGLPITTLTTSTEPSLWKPVPANYFATPSSHSGCADGTFANPGSSSYQSTACTRDYDLAYLDTVITSANSKGLAVNVVPFVVVGGTIPFTVQMLAGYNNDGTTGDLHQDMGTGFNCYGFSVMPEATCYEQMLLTVDVAMVTRYLSKTSSQYFQELYNEPEYKIAGLGGGSWTNPYYWNIGRRAITAAIRAVDPNRWIIDTGISSGKAQYLFALSAPTDPKTIVSFHKYDPAVIVFQTVGNSFDPLAIYPYEGSNEPAIGRPGGVAPSVLGSVPVLNNPSWQTSVNGSSLSCSGAVWTAGGSLGVASSVWPPSPTTGEHQKKACVKGVLTDYYTPSAKSSISINKDYLMNDPTTGISLVVNYARANGHGVGISAATNTGGVTTATTYDDPTTLISAGDTVVVSGSVANNGSGAWNGTFTVASVTTTGITYAQSAPVSGYNATSSLGVIADTTNGLSTSALKVMAGEIGLNMEMDYRSRIQFVLDLRSLLDNTSIPGGQSKIPWDFWSWTGSKIGIKPKGGGASDAHYCLAPSGAFAGVDQDYFASISTPPNNLGTQTPYTSTYCNTATRTDYGTPGYAP